MLGSLVGSMDGIIYVNPPGSMPGSSVTQFCREFSISDTISYKIVWNVYVIFVLAD